MKNGFLRDYVLVPGSDGEAVVVSEGEIDPSFGGINVSMTDIAAYQQDGTTISPALDRPGRCEWVRYRRHQQYCHLDRKRTDTAACHRDRQRRMRRGLFHG